MLIRLETPADVDAIRAVHVAAFGHKAKSPGEPPVEAGLVDDLRACPDWIPALSLVAAAPAGEVIGHVVCTRGRVAGEPVALGLGPLGVHPEWQGRGVGAALMHAVLGAADALGEAVVVLLGHPEYYPRFGFGPAVDHGITPPVAEWTPPYFLARTLTAYSPSIRGGFSYPEPFQDL